MSDDGWPRSQKTSRSAFTLIELLVVVAIIALLIAILLPSLAKARAQARATLCGSRISEFGKAVLMYADDNNETPPFMGCTPGGPEGNGVCDPAENWIVTLPGEWSDAECKANFFRAWLEDWPSEVGFPRSGSLFAYTRHEGLYRCPEFQRVRNPEKTQSAFNYTRPEFGRRFRIPGDPGQSGAGYWSEFPGEGAPDEGTLSAGDWMGPIVRIGAIHASGMLPLLVDEQWDRHVARPPAILEPSSGHHEWHWMDSDPLMAFEDEIGQYHGTPVAESAFYDPNRPIKRGNMLYYDGHVDLRRDPAPSDDATIRDFYSDPLHNAHKFPAILKTLAEMIFAQRGLRAPFPLSPPDW